MHDIVAVLLFAMWQWLAPPAHAEVQQSCLNGIESTKATVSGTIVSREMGSLFEGQNNVKLKVASTLPCRIDVVEIKPEAAPAECDAGRRFHATGTAVFAFLFDVLRAESISCD